MQKSSSVQNLRLSVAHSNTSDQEHDVILEESCGFEFGCGSLQTKRYRTSFFQRFATSRWALTFFGLGALIQGFLVNGHTSAIISTLEKRFELTSTESGLVASCYDIAGSIAILFVTYVGGNGHKPLWIGWGMFLVGLSGVVFSFPHFIAPQYIFSDILNLCGAAEAETCTISALKNFRFIFYGAMLLAGLGSSPIYSLGITYLDENVKQKYSSLYNGILIMLSIIGPGLGFLAGGALLSLYTYPNVEVSFGESSEMWIGAWWIGPLIAGLIGVIISVPVLMLPRVIPGTEKHRIGREAEMHQSAVEDETDENFGEKFSDLPRCVLILFKNPTFVFESLAIALDSLLIGGMTVFGPKYMEIQFGIDPSTAGTYFGILAILGGAGGQLMGGWLIARFDLKIRWMLHICYIAPLLCAASAFSYLITCSETVFAGVTTAYNEVPTSGGFDLASECNTGCGCSAGVFNPVCGSNEVTYFSPCFAGCSAKFDDETFSNCSCVGFGVNSTLPTAAIGACVDERCNSDWELIVFCLCNFALLFFTFFNEAPAIQVSLRCVAFKRRSFAIGIQLFLARLIGTFPGPLVVGAIFDRNCLQWTEECGTNGSCLAYSNSNLALHLFLFIAIGKLLDSLLFLAGLHTYKPINDIQEVEITEDPKSSECETKISECELSSTRNTILPGEVPGLYIDSSYDNPSFTK